jgi:hypothetical protein
VNYSLTNAKQLVGWPNSEAATAGRGGRYQAAAAPPAAGCRNRLRGSFALIMCQPSRSTLTTHEYRMS